MRTALRTERRGPVTALLATLTAVLGLVVLGGVSPAGAQAQPPGTDRAGTSAAGPFDGTTGGTSGGTVGGTSGDTSAGVISGGSSGATSGSSGGTVGPTQPGNPTVVSVTPTSIALTWAPSTDSVGVTRYDVVFDTGDGYATIGSSTTTTATVTGLHPSAGYDLAVRAFDAAGYASPRTAWVYAVTAAIPPTTCSVGYRVVSLWNDGFQGEITVPNPGTTAISDWKLVFDFPLDYTWRETVVTMWGGTFVQSGGRVTVTPASYTSSIPAGGSVTIGFVATGNGFESAPPYFTLGTDTCATT